MKCAGRIREYRETPGGVEVSFQPRGTSSLASFQVARVVNCSGPACDYDRIPHPLIRNLLAEGLVRPDPLRLGLDVTTTCAVRDRQGAISRRLFAVGPVTRGAFWEMTAVAGHPAAMRTSGGTSRQYDRAEVPRSARPRRSQTVMGVAAPLT